MYVPASLLFFIIGASLYAFYQVNPAMIEPVKLQVAAEHLGNIATSQQITQLSASLQPADYGDKVLPHFMVTFIPPGLLGLIVSAILSAAMSTISSNMNSSATVFTMDIYKRYFKPGMTDKQQLSLLKVSTVVFGLIGLCTGLAMIGSKSILDVWWELSGIFAGGMLGLFLLGLISRRTKSPEAFTAVLIGIVVILWMTFSDRIPAKYEFLRSPLHKNMVIVVGTLSIFLAGLLLTYTRRKAASYEP
jgi:SSS family solute:Na+ symporter